MHKCFLTIFLFVFFVSNMLMGQKSNSSDAPYQKEFLYGVNKNTNGGLIGGLMFKYATAMNARTYHALSLEIVHIKNPRERRATVVATGRSFIPYKVNYLYTLRPMYGVERLLFKKAREKGVQVSGMLSAGPSLGIVAPYIVTSNGRNVPYDPNDANMIGTISNVGFFTEGLSDAKLEVGTASKVSLFFEMGSGNRNVGGFEVGITADYYGNEIYLMDQTERKQFFTAGFITLYYGIRS